MEILSYHYKARVTYDELQDGDWIIQINDATEDAVVIADENGILSAIWLANGYSDTLELDSAASYIVLRHQFLDQEMS